MFHTTVPGTAGVRDHHVQQLLDRHPGLRFFTEPEGGAGGATPPGQPDPAPTGGEQGRTTSEEQLGEGGLKALKAERETNAELRRQLKELEDGKLSKDQKLERDFEDTKSKAAALESENATLKLDNARLLVAITEKVPAEWAERIKGATPEEMTADAKKIKASLRDEGHDDRTPGVGQRGDSFVQTTPGMGTLRAAYEASGSK